MNRRTFLRTAAAVSSSLALSTLNRAVYGHAADAKLKTALVGAGWWGMNILGEAMASGACTVVGMCDVDQNQLGPAAEKVNKLTGDTPKQYKDYRELLAEQKPDVVIVATPDHWHPLCTIDAVKAGAHVYVEKPIGHTIKEGRAMVEAARATGKVVQVGTHRRVSPHNVAGRDFIRSGKLGKIGMVRAFVHYGGSGPEQPTPNTEPPAGMDWEMWCGPAPLRPYNKKLHPKGFRQFLDYGNGTLGDWGIHWMDQILWVMERKYPRTVYSTGGRPIKGEPVNDGSRMTTDAPDHQVATFEFEDFTATWEHRQFAANNNEKTHPQQPVGCYFYGTEGVLHVGWKDGTTFYPADGRKSPVKFEPQLNQPDDQNIKELFADFLACIRSGRRPVSDIEEIHRSTNMALLGMLSLKIGRSVKWDGEKELCVGDEEATKLLRREYRGPWRYPAA